MVMVVDGVTGDGVVGAGVVGAGVTGAGVVGAGVTGAGVTGDGVTNCIQSSLAPVDVSSSHGPSVASGGVAPLAPPLIMVAHTPLPPP